MIANGARVIAVVFESPELTREVYEESIRRLTDGHIDRLQSVSDWPVEGLRAHVAGQGEHAFRVIDVWDSEDAFRRFGELLVPILEQLGVREQPEVFPVHAFVTG